MANLFSRHHPHTTDEYVSGLSRQLRRSLPRDKAEQIAGETQAHLEDRVSELTDKGVVRHEAEAVAVAGFGSVTEYTRTTVLSAYGDRIAARFRLLGRLALANLLGWCVYIELLPYSAQKQQIYDLSGTLLAVSLVVVVLAALRSRLPQTRIYCAYLAVAAATLFIGAGLRYVPDKNTPAVLLPTLSVNGPVYDEDGPGMLRGDYTEEITRLREHYVYEEIALLREGIATYSASAPVPASLLSQGRFIVPRRGQWTYGDSDVPVFQEIPGSRAPWESWTRSEFARQPYRTVATRQEAQVIWREVGRKWLVGRQAIAAHGEYKRAHLERVQSAPPTFNTGAATHSALGLLFLCPFLLAADFLLAHLGRAVWIWTRNRRRPQTS